MNAPVTQVSSEVSVCSKNQNVILLLGEFVYWSIIKTVCGTIHSLALCEVLE